MADPNIQELKFNVTDPTFPGLIKPVRNWRLDFNKSTGSYVLYDISFGFGDPPILRNDRVQSGTNPDGTPKYIWKTSVVDSYQSTYNDLNEDSKRFLIETMTKKSDKKRADFVNQSYTPTQINTNFPGMPGTKNIAPAPPTPLPPAPDPTQNPTQNPTQDPNFNLSTIQTGGVVGSSKPNEKIKEILRYPLYQSGGYDYLKINILEYVQSGIPQLSSANLNTIDVEERFRETSILGTIFLPMQPGLSDSAGSSWNEDNLNPVQAAIGGLAGNLINAGGSIDFQRILSELQAAAGGAQSIINNNQILGQFIDNYFAGQIVGSNLFNRSTGAVINPNLELLFNGPKMRTFNYNYRFTPRDNDEARVVRSIIKVLKKNSLPKKDPTGLFLRTPNVFKLKYIFGKNAEEEHPYLNKIKVCALTDMSVNYTPDGSYMTYSDGSMTSYTVTLSFSELNPIYYDDFEDNSVDTPTMGY